MFALHVRLRCGSLSITTTVSLLANELDVRSVLRGQMSLAAVNQTYVIHEAINERLQKSKDLLKACFENLSILAYTCDYFYQQFRHVFWVLRAYSPNMHYYLESWCVLSGSENIHVLFT